MGMNMSSMGIGGIKVPGVSTSQMINMATNKLYEQFVEKDISDFPSFHVAILDIFSTINMALPGKHYDAPSHKDVTELFEQWKQGNDEVQRKNLFIEFMMKNVNLNKVDESMIITAIVAPPAAMVAKRTGQSLPQLKLMKSVPDVLFVPSATVVALIAVKIVRLVFVKKTKQSHDEEDHQVEHKQDQSEGVTDGDGTQPKHAAKNNFCALCNTVH